MELVRPWHVTKYLNVFAERKKKNDIESLQCSGEPWQRPALFNKNDLISFRQSCSPADDELTVLWVEFPSTVWSQISAFNNIQSQSRRSPQPEVIVQGHKSRLEEIFHFCLIMTVPPLVITSWNMDEELDTMQLFIRVEGTRAWNITASHSLSLLVKHVRQTCFCANFPIY